MKRLIKKNQNPSGPMTWEESRKEAARRGARAVNQGQEEGAKFVGSLLGGAAGVAGSASFIPDILINGERMIVPVIRSVIKKITGNQRAKTLGNKIQNTIKGNTQRLDDLAEGAKSVNGNKGWYDLSHTNETYNTLINQNSNNIHRLLQLSKKYGFKYEP